jgi:glycosyltransferase involved in cell wall biosynthesis
VARSYCFVTYELAPVNRGGAGVVVAALAEHLAGKGETVHVIADMPRAEVERYREHVRGLGLSSLTIHLCADLGRPPIGRLTPYRANSLRFRSAVETLANRVPIDVVEFCEYAGMAFDTLVDRPEKLARSAIGVRLHGTLMGIDRAEGVYPTSGRIAMYQQERWSLRLADFVLTPTVSTGEEYLRTYGLDPDRLLLCPPPMERILGQLGSMQPRDESSRRVLFLGKLQAVKGCDVFVEAGVILSERDGSLSFTLIGPDVPLEDGTSTREGLEALIPPERAPAFYFLPRIERAALAEVAGRFLCTVVPSKSEAFCLVAHELARLGCPLVLADITAFRTEFEDGKDCVKFDGTVEGMVEAVERISRNPQLARALSEAGTRHAYRALEPVYATLAPREPPGFADVARWEVDSACARGEAALEWEAPPKPQPRPGLGRRVFDRARRTVRSLRAASGAQAGSPERLEGDG